MSIRETIVATFEHVAKEQSKPLPVLADDLELLQSGLDSLSFALIVARLEDELDRDPFQSTERYPTTFGDFVRLYENCK